MYNAYELDDDRTRYEALVKRNAWGKQPTSIRKGRGGVYESVTDLPGYAERLRKMILDDLNPFIDKDGNVTIEV